MSSPQPVNPDGNLPAARNRLQDAISGLVDPVQQMVEGQLLWTDSWYAQLVEAIPGEKGARTGVSRSQPPLWIDAEDLLREIDTAVAAWKPRTLIDLNPYDQDVQDIPPITVIRLRDLEHNGIQQHGWRPQDVRSMDQISGNIESWTQSVKSLLNPLPKWTLPNPCPACNTAVVYRKDSAGETVRQSALQVGPQGAECMKCHQIWAPEYFTHLARVLGYQLPEGVLE